MNYQKYYPNGWQSGESGGTPITPEALNHIEDGILNLNILIDWFGAGTKLADGTDVNTLPVGKYYVANQTTAATIVNGPVTSEGYVLFVFSRTYVGYLTQLAITGTGRLLIRSAMSGLSYGDWSEKLGRVTVESLIAAITAEDVGALPAADLRRAFAHIDADGNVTSDYVTTYPTEPGVYKTVAAIDGLPTGSSRYGTLVILNGGAYCIHLYMDTRKDVYVTRTNDGGAYAAGVPSSDDWLRIYTTGNGPTPADIGAVALANKPVGSYTGNGSANTWQLDTGIIDTRNAAMLIRASGGTSFAIVTAAGYIGKVGSTLVCGTEVSYGGASGLLTVASADALFNTNGTKYNWYCL